MCGAITYTVSGDLRDVYNCHCARCRRFTGHHMASTATDASHLALHDDGANLQWFYPVPEAGYAFCRRCGSSLFWQSENEQRISICAGTLDPPTGLTTVKTWWTSEASDYHSRPELPELETE